MTKRIESIEHLASRREQMTSLIQGREATRDTLFSMPLVPLDQDASEPNISRHIKMGGARSAVLRSLTNWKAEADEMDDALRTSGPQYRKELADKQKQLAKLQGFVEQGVLDEAKSGVTIFAEKVSAFEALPQRIPALREGLAEKPEEAKTSTPKPERNEPEEALYTLPGGEVVKGEMAALLQLLPDFQQDLDAPNTGLTMVEIIQGLGIQREINPTRIVNSTVNEIEKDYQDKGVEIVQQKVVKEDKVVHVYSKLISDPEDKPQMGISLPYMEKAFAQAPASETVTPSREQVKPEIEELPAKYGDLSENDVAIIAQAMSAYREFLGKVIDVADWPSMLDTKTLEGLSRLGTEKKVKNFAELSVSTQEDVVSALRIQAFDKAKQLVQSDSFDDVCTAADREKEDNPTRPDVSLLFLNLQELEEKVKIGAVTADLPQILVGIDALKAMFTNPGILRKGVSINDVTGHPAWIVSVQRKAQEHRHIKKNEVVVTRIEPLDERVLSVAREEVYVRETVVMAVPLQTETDPPVSESVPQLVETPEQPVKEAKVIDQEDLKVQVERTWSKKRLQEWLSEEEMALRLRLSEELFEELRDTNVLQGTLRRIGRGRQTRSMRHFSQGEQVAALLFKAGYGAELNDAQKKTVVNMVTRVVEDLKKRPRRKNR